MSSEKLAIPPTTRTILLVLKFDLEAVKLLDNLIRRAIMEEGFHDTKFAENLLSYTIPIIKESGQ